MPCTMLVTIARRGGFIQAPMKSTKLSCLVFLKVLTYKQTNASYQNAEDDIALQFFDYYLSQIEENFFHSICFSERTKIKQSDFNL